MIGYIHKGVIKTNGLVDTTKSISSAKKLKVVPSDDGFHLGSPEIGNFEWWYFDVIDSINDIIIKIVVHLGTDPLRKKLFPQLGLSIRTPTLKQIITVPYSLQDFHASIDCCDVRLKNEFHAFVEHAGHDDIYHLSLNVDRFKVNLTFTSDIEGWKPLGEEVTVEKRGKKGAFSWIIPVPKARVVGELCFAT